MGKRWRTASFTVRRRSATTPLLLCLLLAIATGLVVYRYGVERWTPAKAPPAYTARAYAVERPKPVGDSVERSVAPDASMNPGAGSLRLAFIASDDDRQHAVEAANRLAKRHVEQRRAEWRRQMDAACTSAREAAETARQRVSKCEGDVAKARQRLDDAARRETSLRSTPAIEVPPTSPKMIDNPEWISLQRELDGLRRQQEELLSKRTPLHPAVQDVAQRIEITQQQLAATERRIPEPAADRRTPESAARAAHGGGHPVTSDRDNAAGLAAAGTATPSLAAAGTAVSRARETLSRLNATADAARRAYHEAQLVQQKAEQQRRTGPDLSIESACVVRNPSPIDLAWWRLFATSLAAAAAMAAGAGAVGFGVRIERMEASIAEVQADLGEQVAGIVSADYPIAVAAQIDQQARLRRTAIGVGLLLIALCATVAVWGVSGM
ncbi:MAG: hypothetical protein ABFC96_03685 [Thermoguttaceae bacterium]